VATSRALVTLRLDLCALRAPPAPPATSPATAPYDAATAAAGLFTALRTSTLKRLCLWGVTPEAAVHLAGTLPAMAALCAVDLVGAGQGQESGPGVEEIQQGVVKGRAAVLCLAGGWGVLCVGPGLYAPLVERGGAISGATSVCMCVCTCV
jgi:hypothetical protein